MTTAVLQVDRLCKFFGGVRAVNALSFEVRQGEILGLIGPNGSGKSTTVNALAGVFPVTSGEIRLAGGHIQTMPEYERVAMGLARTFQTPSLFPEFTVREQITLGCNATLKSHPLSSVFGIGRHPGEAEAIAARVADILEITALDTVADAPVATITAAQQRFLMIATALASDPRVILLDEPAAGLVSHERRTLSDLIMAIRDKGVSVLVIEHHMALIMEVCDRIVVLNFGSKIAEGTPVRACEMLAAEDFGFAMSLVNTHNVALRLTRSAPPALIARHLPGLLSGQTAACTALTEPGAGSDFAAITACAFPEDGAWHLSGEKTWIINARHAGLAIVFAHCSEAAGANSIGAFAVDLTQPGVARAPIDAAFAQTSMGTGRLTFDRVSLPPEALILPPGGAFKSIMIELNAARTYVAAMCNAMTRAALSEAAAYGAERHSFGKPLAAHQAWRLPLTQAETDLAGAEALTAQATAQIAAGEDAQLSAARAKIAATDAAQRHLPRLLHAMGAEGLRPPTVSPAILRPHKSRRSPMAPPPCCGSGSRA